MARPPSVHTVVDASRRWRSNSTELRLARLPGDTRRGFSRRPVLLHFLRHVTYQVNNSRRPAQSMRGIQDRGENVGSYAIRERALVFVRALLSMLRPLSGPRQRRSSASDFSKPTSRQYGTSSKSRGLTEIAGSAVYIRQSRVFNQHPSIPLPTRQEHGRRFETAPQSVNAD